MVFDILSLIKLGCNDDGQTDILKYIMRLKNLSQFVDDLIGFKCELVLNVNLIDDINVLKNLNL
jgi:hypothetical protein